MRKWKIVLTGENYKVKREQELMDYLIIAKKRHIEIGDFDSIEIYFTCFEFDTTLVKDFLAEYKDNIALLESYASSITDNDVKMSKLQYLILDETSAKPAPADNKANVCSFLANHADTLAHLCILNQGKYLTYSKKSKLFIYYLVHFKASEIPN